MFLIDFTVLFVVITYQSCSTFTQQKQLKFFARSIRTSHINHLPYLWHIQINILCLVRDASLSQNKVISIFWNSFSLPYSAPSKSKNPIESAPSYCRHDMHSVSTNFFPVSFPMKKKIHASINGVSNFVRLKIFL